MKCMKGRQCFITFSFQPIPTAARLTRESECSVREHETAQGMDVCIKLLLLIRLITRIPTQICGCIMDQSHADKALRAWKVIPEPAVHNSIVLSLWREICVTGMETGILLLPCVPKENNTQVQGYFVFNFLWASGTMGSTNRSLNSTSNLKQHSKEDW